MFFSTWEEGEGGGMKRCTERETERGGRKEEKGKR